MENDNKWNDRNLFLTKAIGKYYGGLYDIINFSSWDGFGELFEWCKDQSWWEEKIKDWIQICSVCEFDCGNDISIINPDNFADVVYKYLKGK